MADGLSGLQVHLRHHIALAQEFAGWVDGTEWLERTAPAPFSVVCFRALPPGETEPEAIDSFNMKLMEQVNASGGIFLSHTRLDSGITLRVAIGNLGTEEQDLDLCKKLITEGMACLSNL